LEDVAARVGMSPASVSMVLSGAPGPSAATRERILEAGAPGGYHRDGPPRPAAAARERIREAPAEPGSRPDRTASLLARRRTHLVGVQLQAGSVFHAELVEDLYEAAERHGYDVVRRGV